jgi:hypothetical protein
MATTQRVRRCDGSSSALRPSDPATIVVPTDGVPHRCGQRVIAQGVERVTTLELLEELEATSPKSLLVP